MLIVFVVNVLLFYLQLEILQIPHQEIQFVRIKKRQFSILRNFCLSWIQKTLENHFSQKQGSFVVTRELIQEKKGFFSNSNAYGDSGNLDPNPKVKIKLGEREWGHHVSRTPASSQPFLIRYANLSSVLYKREIKHLNPAGSLMINSF